MPVSPGTKKDPAAVKLGRKGGRKGGLTRAANMTPEQRSESARKAVQARWARTKSAGDILNKSEHQEDMRTFSEFVEPHSDGLFEMANISSKRTGLPFMVWISTKEGARQHDVRVKVSKGRKAHASEWVSVALRPDVRIVGGEMTGPHFALLKKWIELNRDVIIKYWDGDIEDTQDAIDGLKPIH